MNFETFRGKDVNEAVAAVKAAFGPDAVIGSTRHVSNGKRGSLGSSFVEVTAAPGAPPEIRTRLSPFSRDMLPHIKKNNSSAALTSRSPIRVSKLASAALWRGTSVQPADLPQDSIETELRAVRALLEEMTTSRKPRDRAISMLHAAGIEGALAAEVAAGATRAARGGPDTLRTCLRDRVASRLTVLSSPIAGPGRRVIACIGPTGVGKTTTLAKLAAQAHFELNRSVAVISLDTFRVGAVEQMRRFCELIGVPFTMAHDRASFEKAAASYDDVDILLVDTASRAPSDKVAMGELAKCLAAVDKRTLDILLALPASIRPRDVERLSSVYETCPPTGLVITKVDETDQIGGTIHAAIRGKTPIAYVCGGPRVPEDLAEASVEALLDMLFSQSKVIEPSQKSPVAGSTRPKRNSRGSSANGGTGS